MFSLLLTLAISGGILIFLTLLFRIERKRGKRFFPRVRQWFDAGIVALYRLFGNVTRMLGREAVRHTAHYVFHRILKALRELFRALEQRTDRLLRANKELAKRALRREAGAQSKLDQIAAHKADIALTPKEKQKHKEKSVGTKL